MNIPWANGFPLISRSRTLETTVKGLSVTPIRYGVRTAFEHEAPRAWTFYRTKEIGYHLHNGYAPYLTP